MSELSEQLKERTMTFAMTVLQVVDALPYTAAGRVVATQLAKCATSVASNYRASCSGRSRREFIARLGIVVEEADETVFWLELIHRGRLLLAMDLSPVSNEAVALRNIFAKSLGTARANVRSGPLSRPNGQKDPCLPNGQTRQPNDQITNDQPTKRLDDQTTR